MIRKLIAEDCEFFIDCCREFYRSEAVLENVPESNFHKTFEAVLNDSPFCDGFILEKDSKKAGYALVSVTYSNEAGGKVVWLEELYLLPHMRAKGLGHEFFEWAHTYYKDAARFRLEVEKDNERAISLYERLGYRPLEYYQMFRKNEVK